MVRPPRLFVLGLQCCLIKATVGPNRATEWRPLFAFRAGGSYLLAVARSYLSQSLTRPLRTKDGGTLRTILGARSYILQLSKARQRSAQWQRAAQLAKADVGAFSRQIELALVYDGKLDVTELPNPQTKKAC
jgi:hypothetical protein